MTMRLSMIVEAETGQAKQNVDQLTSSTRQLGTVAQGTERQTTRTSRSTNLLGRAFGGVRTRAAQATATIRGYLASLRGLGQETDVARGSVANLGAQFNDIGVMMAAGQSPLQLALQQGTQITQVIGPMGAAGAAKALGSAFVSMINPVSLITIGSIAAGAAMFQWLTGAKEDAQSLEEQIDSLIDQIDAYRKAFRRDDRELQEIFGRLSPELRDLLTLELELDREDFLDKAGDLGREGAEEILDEMMGWFTSRRTVVRDLLGDAATNQTRRGRRDAQPGQINELEDRITGLGEIEDLQEQLAAVRSIRETISGSRDAQGQLNDTQREFLSQLVQIEAGLLRSLAGVREEERAFQGKVEAQMTAYAASRVASDQAVSSAQEMLTALSSEVQLRDAIREHGEGSIEVAELRLAAERRAFSVQLEALDVSESLKAEIMGAWDAANGIAGVDISGGITLAADEAHRLTQNLMNARGAAMMGQIRQNPDFHDPRGATVGSSGAGNPDYIYREQSLPPVTMPSNPRNRRGGRGGAARETERQRQAVTDLIAELQNELAILNEADPVQKELLRLRDQMVGATEQQKQTIAELVAQQVAETAQIEAQQDAYGLLMDASSNAISGMISDADSLEDALKNVVSALLDATIQAQLFGNGPLAGLFGTSNSGGFFGSIVGGLLPALSQQSAPIAPAIAMSAMQADLASRPKAPLGYVEGAQGAPIRQRDLMDVTLKIEGAQTPQDMQEAALKGVEAALDQRLEDYTLNVLPQAVADANNTPWRR